LAMICHISTYLRRQAAKAIAAALFGIAALSIVACWTNSVRAQFTPESPEVKKVVESALAFLAQKSDPRLGGKCLIGLAFQKAGKTNHPKIREAIDECLKVAKANLDDANLDTYSNGLAVIFLCEVSPKTYAREIEYYMARLRARQKDHGGWGYSGNSTGDTSQTQYGALACWEANRFGFNVDGKSIEKLADWLVRTQAPEGSWGYQGQVAPTDVPIPQDEATLSLLAAAMGSAYICADLFSLRPGSGDFSESESPRTTIPSALRRIEGGAAAGEPKRYHLDPLQVSKLFRAIERGHAWMKKNYAIDMGSKTFYYMYGLERYKSFQEALEGSEETSPKWYNDGYSFLASKQQPDGSWLNGYCGPECDTSFAVLFLLRSTKKSIKAKLAEGMLQSGRGLPSNLARARMHNGQLIAQQVHTKVDELLSMIDDGKEGALDELARDPSQLVVEKVDDKSARRLQQLIRGGNADVRILAVRALGRTGNLDYVPSLLYALTDPDMRVVLEARNGLRFISRNFDGFGPPDDFSEQQRYDAVDAWKNWYKSIRPAAVLEK
jgi:hypothetical protein